jgi:hypothetical protein
MWPTIGLIGTDYFVNRDPSQGFAYVGDSNYGDLAHQMGLGANGSLVPYVYGNKLVLAASDYIAGSATVGGVDDWYLAPTTLEYTLLFDRTNPGIPMLTGSVSANGVDWMANVRVLGLKDNPALLSGGAEFDDYSDVLFSFMCANNANAGDGIYYRPMGLDVAWTVATVAPTDGDTNHDGAVDIFDINLVSSHWLQKSDSSDAIIPGDATGNSIVDIFDVNLISANWAPAPGGAAAVPEPATLGLATLAAAGLCLAMRRKRN